MLLKKALEIITEYLRCSYQTLPMDLSNIEEIAGSLQQKISEKAERSIIIPQNSLAYNPENG